MRMLICAWRGIAVRRIGNKTDSVAYIVLIAVVLLMGMQCQGCHKTPIAATSNPVSDEKEHADQHATLQRKKTLQYHVYGQDTLYAVPGSKYSFEGLNKSKTLKISENYPGILIYSHRHGEQRGRNASLMYYDTTNKKLLKHIDIEAITPYNEKKYPKIEYGHIDFEYDEVISPLTDCILPKMPSPDHYRTYNQFYPIGNKGNFCLGFALIKTNKSSRKIVGWEQTLTILNNKGKALYTFKTDHEFADLLMTSDERYLAFAFDYLTGDYPGPCIPSVQIHDIEKKERIFYYEGEKHMEEGYLYEHEGLIFYNFVKDLSEESAPVEIEQLVINTNEKYAKCYRFIWDKKYLPEKPDYIKYLETQPFKTIKF